ncbi:MAG TPA: hypothetical protein DCE23_08945 [Firmicutes bacterium]|nr:hypothetical protein [Bacillota bacterium]
MKKQNEDRELAEEVLESQTKTPNIIFFFIKLILIFLIFDYINPYIYRTIGRAIIYGKFSQEIIIEAVCSCIILFVLLLAGNKYIFNEKRISFFKSIGVGGAMFGIATLLLLTNSSSILDSSSTDILSLALYCLFIGIFEEFMCRGWIQNELIERYSNNRNQAILSIALSSLIFGGMHISNIWIGGQGVIETLSQVIQATGMGIYLGAIYYRTKNIWGNVFLHGFWDFSILLGEINVIKSCSEGNTTSEYVISQLITAVIFLVIYTLLGLYILRKSKLADQYNYTEEEIILSEKRKDRLVFIIFVLFMSITYIVKENENQVCYEYEEKEVIMNETTTPNYTEYYFNENDYHLKLYLSNNILKLKNIDTEEEINLDIKDITKFMVVKDKEYYHILAVGLNKYKTDNVLYYSNYIF